jgi:3-hydroxybutyryl-CoA dehydratase
MADKGHKCDMFFLGQKTSISKLVTSNDILTMARVSGDMNPIHTDESYAAKHFFGRRIAHGLFCLGMVSNILGTKLPGEGTILVSETVNYKMPVYVDDTITTTVTILEILYEKDKITFAFKCINQNGGIVTDGTAITKCI